MRLEPREKRVVAGGAAVATLLLLFLLWPGEPDAGAVELVPSDQRTAPAPQPAPAVVAVAAAPAPPPPVVATPEGLALHGVMASGAVIGFADGSQRYVAVGREVMPGLRLEAVQLHHAILAAGTTNYRLGFGGAASAIAPAGQAPAPTAALASNAAETRRMATERAETTRFRQALAPQGGQGSGYTLRPGFSLPVLAQAGVQPGDTILGVNGSRLGAEQLEELAWTIANSDRTELEIERGGRRMRVSISPPR